MISFLGGDDSNRRTRWKSRPYPESLIVITQKSKQITSRKFIIKQSGRGDDLKHIAHVWSLSLAGKVYHVVAASGSSHSREIKSFT